MVAPIKGILKTLVCSYFSDLLGVAEATNKTVGEGVGGSFGIGFIFGGSEAGSIQVVADPSGNLGIAFSGSPGFVVTGASAMIGVTGSVSTSKSIYGLRGWSLNGDISAGGGPAGNIGVSQSFNSQGWGPTTVSGTVGVGVGTKFAVGSVGLTGVPQTFSTNCKCGNHV